MNIARLRNRILQMLRSTIAAQAFEKNNYMRGWMHGVQFAATYIGEAVDEMEESASKSQPYQYVPVYAPYNEWAGTNFPIRVERKYGPELLETYDRKD